MSYFIATYDKLKFSTIHLQIPQNPCTKRFQPYEMFQKSIKIVILYFSRFKMIRHKAYKY